jgi:hypothetical protein
MSHSVISFCWRISDRQRRKRQEAASREARTLELKRANEAINAGKSDNKKEEYNPFAEVERPVASTSYKPNKVSYHFPFMGVELISSPCPLGLFELSTRILETIFPDHLLSFPNPPRSLIQKRKRRNHPHPH